MSQTGHIQQDRQSFEFRVLRDKGVEVIYGWLEESEVVEQNFVDRVQDSVRCFNVGLDDSCVVQRNREGSEVTVGTAHFKGDRAALSRNQTVAVVISKRR